MTGDQDAQKQAAGRHAATYVETGMKVGLGTGTTVHHAIVALGERATGPEGLRVTCTATSVRSEELARSVGLEVVAPDEVGRLDIALDGADEVAASFDLTKGGGGAHTREKIVAQMSPRFLVVVDESKLVDQLGAFGTPLEVLPFAPEVAYARVRALGASEVVPRTEPSDNGNILADARFGSIADPAALARLLDAVPGIVEHGLFLAPMVERVIVGGPQDVRELVRTPS